LNLIIAAENKVKYFLDEDIESELKCLACYCRYDIPNCVCSICSKCESTYEKNVIKFQCPICKQNNDLQSNHLPVNKFIRKLL
jgi:hypothetical protein